LESGSRMFETLLRLAVGRGTANTSELAHELDVTPALVREMLEEMTQRDYLEAVVLNCSMPCKRCPLHAVCAYHNQPRIWSLTRKGDMYLALRR